MIGLRCRRYNGSAYYLIGGYWASICPTRQASFKYTEKHTCYDIEFLTLIIAMNKVMEYREPEQQYVSNNTVK